MGFTAVNTQKRIHKFENFRLVTQTAQKASGMKRFFRDFAGKKSANEGLEDAIVSASNLRISGPSQATQSNLRDGARAEPSDKGVLAQSTGIRNTPAVTVQSAAYQQSKSNQMAAGYLDLAKQNMTMKKYHDVVKVISYGFNSSRSTAIWH